MPYKLEEANGGYYVVNEQTGKRKNKTPISKERAVKYMRALYAAESGTEMHGKEIAAQVLTAFTEKMEFANDDQRKAVMAAITSGGDSPKSESERILGRSKKKRNEDIKHLSKKPLSELRKNQDLVRKQMEALSKKIDPKNPDPKFDRSFRDLQARSDDYAAAIRMQTKEVSSEVLTAFKRNFDPNTGGGVDRDKLAASDFVDPERRRFPIVKATDIMDAVHSYGRAKPPIPFEEFKRRVIAIAKRKGFVSSLPKDWKVKEVTTKSIGSMVESDIHRQFTNRADDFYGQEWITRDERITLSSAIGDALAAFVKRVEKDAPQLYKDNISDRADLDASHHMPPQPDEAWKEASPALIVYKDATGADRWVTFSSNSYQDRDKEIVSQAALEADVERTDKEGGYGPLRWWHVGKPDPIALTAGPGLDLGDCDFSAMHGRVLVESGTFRNKAMAEAVKESKGLQVSIGYFHPKSEPDSEGVFRKIRRFERSLLPAGRASNPFTAMAVIETKGESDMKLDKIKAFISKLKDEEQVDEVLKMAEVTEEEAQKLKTAYKESVEMPESTPDAEAVIDAPVETVDEGETEGETELADKPEPEYEPTIADLSPAQFTDLLAKVVDTAMEPHRKEVQDLQASMKLKDDSESALRESLASQAQTIATLKSQLDELLGQQPRAATKGYRASQDADTVVKDDSRVKGKQPTVDPDFIKMFTP